MAVGRALIRLWSVGPSDAGAPRLAVVPEADLETPARERDRVDREAGRAALLVADASAEQARMLGQLAAQSVNGELRFPSVEILEGFLAATASVENPLTDVEVIAAWQDAGGEGE